jgi:hypothetical protein
METCEGSGLMDSNNGSKIDESRDANMQELEIVCPRCKGEAYRNVYGEDVRCGVCNGAGFVPTRLGNRILRLVRHNFRPMHEDFVED